MNKRIAVLFACLAVNYVAIRWITSGNNASAAPAVNLAGISKEIDGWVGEDVDIIDEIVKVLNAKSYINRMYRDSAGHTISLHVADWSNPDTIVAAPHPPEVCFAGAGWSLLDRRTTQFSTAKGQVPIELILFRKGQQYVVTGHWFRTGDVTYFDTKGFQDQRRRFWGTSFWPDTTKVLIQVAAPTLDAAEKSILIFATKVADQIDSSGRKPQE